MELCTDEGAKGQKQKKQKASVILNSSDAAEQIHLQSCDLSFYHSQDEHKSRFSISIFRPLQGHPCINSEMKQDSSSLLIRFLFLKTGLLLYMSMARLKSPERLVCCTLTCVLLQRKVGSSLLTLGGGACYVLSVQRAASSLRDVRVTLSDSLKLRLTVNREYFEGSCGSVKERDWKSCCDLDP